MESSESDLKADFIRHNIFISGKFLLWLEEKLKKEPGFLDRIETIINKSDLKKGGKPGQVFKN